MDNQACINLHAQLKARGFSASLEDFQGLLTDAEDESEQRSVIDQFKSLRAPRQLAALHAVYDHARKHKMTITTFKSLMA